MNTSKIIATLATIVSISSVNATEKVKIGSGSNYSVAFSEDGKISAIGGYKKAFLIDTATKRQLKTLEGAKGKVSELAIVGDRVIATGGRYLGIWDIQSGSTIKIIETKDDIYKFAVCRKTKKVYGGNKFVQGWDINTGKVVMKTELLSERVKAIAVSPNGNSLYVYPRFGKDILVFSTKTGKEIGKIKGLTECESMVVHPDGKSLFVKRFGKSIKQISLKGKTITDIGFRTTIGQLYLSDSGKHLLIGTWSTPLKIEEVSIYDITKKKTVKTIPVSESSNYEAKMSSDSKIIAVVTKDGFVHFIPYKNIK